jgi:hypothetical protein
MKMVMAVVVFAAIFSMPIRAFYFFRHSLHLRIPDGLFIVVASRERKKKNFCAKRRQESKMDTSSIGGSSAKEQACAQVYLSRMLKLQQKLNDMHLFFLYDANDERNNSKKKAPTGASSSPALMEPAVPQQFIDIGWGEKDTENVALFGNVLPLSRTWEKPNVIFEASDGVFYSVVAVDADAVGGPYLLWARFNISGDTNFSSGRDLVRWQPPHPLASELDEATGRPIPHRIFFLVFHQPGGQADPFDGSKIISKSSRESRSGFDLTAFRDRHCLGHFIGANGYCVKHDALVVDKILEELRDRVVLDPSGKRVLQEVNRGVIVYDAAAYKASTAVVTSVPNPDALATTAPPNA